ncbi:MAG: sugar ABC transporter ATP-binding protein [Clostridia bacterium]|nr:sugar ABC transporter ATP-binding protein [Clostridia bacterium]
MDELTASLTDNDIDNLFKVVKGLAQKGISIIYISHRLEELPVIADRITVFRDGLYVTTLDTEKTDKEMIIEHMVGKDLEHTSKTKKVSDQVLLKVQGLNGGRFSDISFELHKGEILGLSGLAGAGRTELARSIFGLDPIQSGEIIFKSKKVKINSPQDAKNLGIGFVTEDRKGEGIIPRLDIKENISITVLDRITKHMSINMDKEKKLAQEYIKYLDIKATSIDQILQKLSGGNQQKVIIAKWLAVNPSVLILDEPTRGIDVGAKGQIYSILNKLADQGMGIIVISSEIPEILQISDRILVMADGKLTKELAADEASQEKILYYATTQNKDRAAM